MIEEMKINQKTYRGDQKDYDAIQEAILQLSSSSQEQFEAIKKEKWYNRVFDMITFSQKGKIRLADQVGTIAQAQQLFIELLLRLSANDNNISSLVTKSMEDIRKIQGQNMFLLSKINHLENIALGIKADMDLNRLSEKGKQVLSACLYKINSDDINATQEQKKYANSVLAYLDLDIQMENPTFALKGMDNDSKRRILTCCMEYLFLKNCSSDSYNNYIDFIDEFDFGNKTVKGIEEQIYSLYNLRGSEGFYSKYQPYMFDEIDDIFELEFDEAFENVESIEDVVMEDEFISSILQIRAGETKLYRNKNIHISAYINCEGNLEFDNCILYYNEKETADEITLARGSKMSIKNSLVLCKGFDESPFISCEGDNSISLEANVFVDCSNFIKAGNDCSLMMTRCEIKNCYEGFISIYVGENNSCEISSNLITQDKLSGFNLKKSNSYSNACLISVSSLVGTKVNFHENIIVQESDSKNERADNEKVDNKISYFICDSAEVKNCTFIGLSTAIRAPWVRECNFIKCTEAIYVISNWCHSVKPVIDNCVFEESTNIIRTADDTKITNCQFVSCYNNLVFPGGDNGGVGIEFCQFINTENLVADDPISVFLDGPASLTFMRSEGSRAKTNYIRKCIFDGVKLADKFIIAAKSYVKPSGVVTLVEECDFKNCSTKHSSGKIINEFIQYDSLLKKNLDFQANQVTNCRGLDRVNNEGYETDMVVVKTTSSLGNPIGSIAVRGVSDAISLALSGSALQGVFVGISTINKLLKSIR